MTDVAGAVTTIGTFSTSANFGTGKLSSAGGLDVFVAQYSHADGSPLWAKRYGGTGDDYGNAVAAGPNGELAIAGQFSSTIDFGGGALSNAGAPDIFVAHLSATGAYDWAGSTGRRATTRRSRAVRPSTPRVTCSSPAT